MKIYLVGGAIRDKLLNIPVKDKDWVVVGATPKIMIELGYYQVGNNFPVFIHPISKEEYALARTEKKNGKGHKGFITYFNKYITIEEDLIRRDLTINAIAQDSTGNYIDPCGGIKDINEKKLKHVSNAFIEDPLRVLRVARFASSLFHLGFKIEKETIFLMKKVVKSKEMYNLSKERIWKETEKAIKSFQPHIYFKVLNQCKTLDIFFPKNYFNSKKNIFLDKNNLKKNMYLINKFLKKVQIISSLKKDFDSRFVLICLFLVEIIFLIKNNDIGNINFIKFFCKNLKIPKYLIKLVTLSIKCNKLFHKKIKKNKAIFINNLLDCIDAWRKPYLIKKISALMLIFYSFNKKKIRKYNIYLNNKILSKCREHASKVFIEDIINKKIDGLQIKKEIKRRRIKIISCLIKKNFFK